MSKRNINLGIEKVRQLFKKPSDKEQELDLKQLVKTPIEGKWFKVDVNSINKKLFKKPRADDSQEFARQLILNAFSEFKNHPELYSSNFLTMFPRKTWKVKSVKELEALACKNGNYLATWVEQALEWAQRIQNGESWEDLCNMPDSSKWCRLILWDNSNYRLVGDFRSGTLNGIYTCWAATDISETDFYSNTLIPNAVPLIVCKTDNSGSNRR